MNKSGNVIFCGVGGQGILLASEITSDALMKAGFDVKRSEVHGMAQRGGSVIAHLRYGDRVFSPIIEPGRADIEVSFEMLEALRYVSLLHPGSRVVVNIQKIPPLTVSTGNEPYPEGVIDELKKKDLDVIAVDALEIARSLGEIRAVNMVLVGVLSHLLPVPEELFLEALHERVPEKIRTVNVAAFKKGREAIDTKMETAETLRH
ncbi:MAG: indolepyruvate oxidoreductase subunit beta [bacterium]